MKTNSSKKIPMIILITFFVLMFFHFGYYSSAQSMILTLNDETVDLYPLEKNLDKLFNLYYFKIN